MCLNKLTTTEPLTAQKNIFCWKKLNKNKQSYVQDYYKYEIGSLQEKTVSLKISPYGEIEQGYHSWIKKYSISNHRRANYLFVIPKGTQYFEGFENSEKPGYVSSNIICLGHWLSPMTWIRAFKYQSENDKK